MQACEPLKAQSIRPHQQRLSTYARSVRLFSAVRYRTRLRHLINPRPSIPVANNANNAPQQCLNHARLPQARRREITTHPRPIGPTRPSHPQQWVSSPASYVLLPHASSTLSQPQGSNHHSNTNPRKGRRRQPHPLHNLHRPPNPHTKPPRPIRRPPLPSLDPRFPRPPGPHPPALRPPPPQRDSPPARRHVPPALQPRAVPARGRRRGGAGLVVFRERQDEVE